MFWLICNFSSENLHVSLTDGSNTEEAESEHKRRKIPSASSALVIGIMLGIVQTVFLIFAAKSLLSYMGVNSVSVPLAIPLLVQFVF